MRRSPRLDFTKREIEFPDAGVFALGGVSPSVIPGLALVGLKHTLLTATDPQVTYIDLTNGVMKFRKLATKSPDPWHEAMAFAIAEQQAILEAGPKAKASLIASIAGSYVEGMRTHVATLPKETLKTMKAHPSVIQHHSRITGAGAGQTSLLAIAGVMPELALPAPVPETVELGEAAD